MEVIVLIAVLLLVAVGLGTQWKQDYEAHPRGMQSYTPEEALKRVAWVLECKPDPIEVVTQVESIVEMMKALQHENERLRGERP